MSIHLITGCMFSGKTSALINAAKMNKLLNKKVLIINFNGDTRYCDKNKISTHDNVQFDCIPCASDLLFLIIGIKEYNESDVICINEGQFFDNLVNFCLETCKLGKEVHVCGLDGDYLKRPFGEILNLIPHCDTVYKLNALCMSCKNGNSASFTKKIVESNNLVEIGSTEMYMPVCRKCYDKTI
jgi:thymidine kinase